MKVNPLIKCKYFWGMVRVLNFFLPKEIRKICIKKQKFKVLNKSKTLEMLQNKKYSFARFGDGEISILIGGRGPAFQRSNSELREKLWSVLSNNNILIGWPSRLAEERNVNEFWLKFRIKNFLQLLILSKIFNRFVFGNAQITRPYINNFNKYDKKEFDRYFNTIKNLFFNEDILIVEGEKTRFGVGNDLLNQARSIRRILVPAVDANKKYAEIFNSIKSTFGHKYLYIIACGPVAKVLVSEIANNGELAWDLGHLDVEYEWFMRNAEGKISIPGKYVNEAKEKFSELNDIYNDDKNYQSQIICKVS